ncbi:MAG: diguanylate cyclase, partial [Candidatus Margulisbacteria bacterium]|nr:diguanylate cyclase [Candidatus Margulisiibacteriota bacterium]
MMQNYRYLRNHLLGKVISMPMLQILSKGRIVAKHRDVRKIEDMLQHGIKTIYLHQFKRTENDKHLLIKRINEWGEEIEIPSSEGAINKDIFKDNSKYKTKYILKILQREGIIDRNGIKIKEVGRQYYEDTEHKEHAMEYRWAKEVLEKRDRVEEESFNKEELYFMALREAKYLNENNKLLPEFNEYWEDFKINQEKYYIGNDEKRAIFEKLKAARRQYRKIYAVEIKDLIWAELLNKGVINNDGEINPKKAKSYMLPEELELTKIEKEKMEALIKGEQKKISQDDLSTIDPMAKTLFDDSDDVIVGKKKQENIKIRIGRNILSFVPKEDSRDERSLEHIINLVCRDYIKIVNKELENRLSFLDDLQEYYKVRLMAEEIEDEVLKATIFDEGSKRIEGINIDPEELARQAIETFINIVRDYNDVCRGQINIRPNTKKKKSEYLMFGGTYVFEVNKETDEIILEKKSLESLPLKAYDKEYIFSKVPALRDNELFKEYFRPFNSKNPQKVVLAIEHTEGKELMNRTERMETLLKNAKKISNDQQREQLAEFIMEAYQDKHFQTIEISDLTKTVNANVEIWLESESYNNLRIDGPSCIEDVTKKFQRNFSTLLTNLVNERINNWRDKIMKLGQKITQNIYEELKEIRNRLKEEFNFEEMKVHFEDAEILGFIKKMYKDELEKTSEYQIVEKQLTDEEIEKGNYRKEIIRISSDIEEFVHVYLKPNKPLREDQEKDLTELIDALGDRLRKSILSIVSIRDLDTYLYNRRYFKNKIRKNLEEYEKLSKNMGLIFLDADNFKFWNDAVSHDFGDQILKAISEGIREICNKANLQR